MDYLVDVNCSKSDKFLVEHPEYTNVKYKIGEKVEDQEIMKYAKNKECVLYTQDKRFALDALIAGLKVWYRDQGNGKDYKLETHHVQFS